MELRSCHVLGMVSLDLGLRLGGVCDKFVVVVADGLIRRMAIVRNIWFRDEMSDVCQFRTYVLDRYALSSKIVIWS